MKTNEARKPIAPKAEPPSSIEHQLDMEDSETNLTGERVARNDVRPVFTRGKDRDPREMPEIANEFNMDLAEADREGDEMSGDEHSSGLQGNDSELEKQPHIDSGLPGEETEDDESSEIDLEKRRLDRAA